MLTAKPFRPDLVLAPSTENSERDQPLPTSAPETRGGSFAAAMKRALTKETGDASPEAEVETVPTKTVAGQMDSAARGRGTRSGNSLRDKKTEPEKNFSTWPTIVTAKVSKPIPLLLEEAEDAAKASAPDSESQAMPKLTGDPLLVVPATVPLPAPALLVPRAAAPPPLTGTTTVTPLASEPGATTISPGTEQSTAPESRPAVSTFDPTRSQMELAKTSSSPPADRPRADSPPSLPLMASAPSVPESRINLELAGSADTFSATALPGADLVDSDGITTAKNSPRMKKVEESHQVSRKANPPLPSAATLSTDSADNARPGKPETPTAPPPNRDSSLVAEAIHPDLAGTASLRRSERTSPALESARPEPAAAVSALEHEILTRVAELRRLRPDSMSMLLRPDAQTEVHLHLQLQDGVVEIEAKLQRGEWSVLGAQWGQLQQNLSGQGVRLSALSETSTADSGGRNGTGSFPQQSSSRREQQEESLRPEFPWPQPGVSLAAAKEKRPGPANRSSEWWA